MNNITRLTLACSVAAGARRVSRLWRTTARRRSTRQKEVTVNGTVKSYRFANPHVQLVVTVKKDDGSTVDMDVEAGAASVLNGLGFGKDSLKVGDIVTITGNPARQNADAHMLGKDLYKKADGSLPAALHRVEEHLRGEGERDGHQHRGHLVLADAQLHGRDGRGQPGAADRQGPGGAQGGESERVVTGATAFRSVSRR